jgi:hypothetical protein
MKLMRMKMDLGHGRNGVVLYVSFLTSSLLGEEDETEKNG